MDNRSPTPRRYRSSTSNSSPPVQVRTSALASIVQRLSNLTTITTDSLRSTHDDLTRLSIFFDDNGQNDVQDQFRQIRGFQAVLHVLETAVQYAEVQGELANNSLQENFVQIAIDVLNILTRALRRHHGNSRYFTKRVSGGGWQALRHLVQHVSSVIVNSSVEENQFNDLLRLFGATLALALGDVACNNNSEASMERRFECRGGCTQRGCFSRG